MAKGLDLSGIELPTKQTILPNSGGLDTAKASAELLGIDVISKPMAQDEMAELAFMEEKLEVMLHEATDPNAENPVHVAVNGVNQFFMRGVPQVVRRKYVGVLAGAKRGNITTPEITQNGERTAAIRKTQALAYPFSVIRDDNPRGASWLRGLLEG